MARVLVLDDDGAFRKSLCRALAARGHKVTAAAGGAEALGLAQQMTFDAAFIDMKMPGMSGLEFLKALRRVSPSVAGIILTGFGSIPDAVQTLKLGGFHYLTKPVDMAEIEKVLEQAVRPTPDPASGPVAAEGTVEYQGIVGRSRAVKSLIETVRKVKDAQLPVLIVGESGTGKELVARALHYDSRRGGGPFVPINCASLKPELLENELFGHVKGAFTGAVENKRGLVRASDGGTLFIDEIADMNPVVQAGILRFIENGMVRPLGASRETKVSTRIVAAINRNIEDEVRAGRFRLDLYYRLNVCRINIAPLRERMEDVPVLAEHFLSAMAGSTGRRMLLSGGAVERLLEHNWPGNVRELHHVLQRAVILHDGDVITADHIDRSIEFKRLAVQTCGFAARGEEPATLEESERRHIIASLELNGWNVSRTARALRIDRRTLQRKISRYDIKKARPGL
ncbi:MAG TPA: sigma-54-dependent Fis family transcriptional regulator [Deltaproteobacteria bacterium]|nr:sigma-54-dependent Fis family transcriptional regulator [Deltaproteobacteria bacterium]